MTSYLRSWLPGGSSSLAVPTTSAVPSAPEILRISPPISDDEDDGGEDTETEHTTADDDSPPAFPSLSSAQRVQQAPITITPRVLTDSSLMPPPPLPALATRRPGVPSNPTSTSSSLFVPPSASGSLAVPPSTTKRPAKPSKKRDKVALSPGHSPLDWAKLKSSGEDLRVRPACLVLSCSQR